MKSLQKKL